MSFIVRVAEPAEYAEAGRVTAGAYRADDLLRRTDGVTDTDYEAELTDAGRRAREAELLVAVDDGHVLGTVTWCPPSITVARARDASGPSRVSDALGGHGWAPSGRGPRPRKGVLGSGASRGDA